MEIPPNIHFSYFSKDVQLKKICIKDFKPTRKEEITLPYTKNDEAVLYPNGKVTSYYQIYNNKENFLGYQIPSGSITIYDDEIENRRLNTVMKAYERDAEMLILVPNDSFDITVKRERFNFDVNLKEGVMTENIHYLVTNNTDEEFPIEIRQHIYRTSDWKLDSSDDEFTDVKMFTNEVMFTVLSEANSEKIFACSIQYNWEPEVEEKKKTIFSSIFG